jgi:hypothetical protein
MKRVIQTYKAPAQWVDEPPGLGDFVRGGCHLFEKLQSIGIELRIDVSQTEYADLIEQDESVFQTGEAKCIASAEEYFENEEHLALNDRLMSFLHSNETELYVSTNLGAWDRTTLPQSTREFIGRFYRFNDEVERMTAQSLRTAEYEVLSVRCGDEFFGESNAKLQNDVWRLIFSIIERHVLARAQSPVVVTSDCHELKVELARRYGMLTLPHRSRHGAFGGVLPVAMDTCMLKNSRFNYHINCFADWWSGFSHYTSMIFTIPSMNFRAPRFAKEEITAQGLLVKARPWWSALKRA